MVFKVAMPGRFQFKIYRREAGFLTGRQGDVHYIGGSEVLPPPLEADKENAVISDLGTEYENKKVYCILSGDEIIVIEFIPLRGIGGISTQREEFEKILDTLVIE